jgi:transposase
MKNFRIYDQTQGVFRNLYPEQLLEEDHPARIIDKVVESLDLTELYGSYSEEGTPAYHPKMMLKVMFYSYFDGTMTGRKVEKNLEDRASYIFLSGDQVPDFRTINAFRVRHMDILPSLFAQIVMLCRALDMIGFKNLAVDGQKIQANANFTKSYNNERLVKRFEKLTKGMEKLLACEPTNANEEKLRKRRLGKLRKQKEKLEGAKEMLRDLAKENANATINLTDKDAPMMSHKDRTKKPSYNNQSAVDGKLGVTVAVQTTITNDNAEHLEELNEQAKENTGALHENILADCGFCDYEHLEKMVDEKNPQKYYVPDPRFDIDEKGGGKLGKYDSCHFEFDEEGTLRCPEGKDLKQDMIKQFDGYTLTQYSGTACETCSARSLCTKGKKRTITIDSRSRYKEIMRRRLRDPEGKAIYRKRQAIVEAPHGDDQKNKKWRQHYLRGRDKTAIEFLLIRIGSNLGKIIRFRSVEMLVYSVS